MASGLEIMNNADSSNLRCGTIHIETGTKKSINTQKPANIAKPLALPPGHVCPEA
jgi:hypothetical protein